MYKTIPDLEKCGTGSNTLDELLYDIGYIYDPLQDIFFSHHDAWQRKFGYFRLYDEMMALLFMIVDCEPVYFNYDNRRWMIEFWKGQYGMATGGEIGIYYTDRDDIHIQNIFSGPFFQCAEDHNMLYMTATLYKNGKPLLKRADRHWWLTGFVLGEDSFPSELTMKLSIRFHNKTMLQAFLGGFHRLGYRQSDYRVSGTNFYFTYGTPHSQQPSTRTPQSEMMVQWQNKIHSDRYRQITKDYPTITGKLEAIRTQTPELYELILRLGKNKQLHGNFAATRL